MNTFMRQAALSLSCLALAGCGRQAAPEPSPPPAQPAPAAPPAPPKLDAEGQAASWQIKTVAMARDAADGDARRIARLVSSIKDAPPASSRDAELVRVEGLRVSVDEALAAAHGLSEHLLSVLRELRHATIAYDAAARGFRERAADYADENLKGDCIVWAEKFEGLIASVPGQISTTEALLSQVGPTIGFVRQTKNLLSDYHLFLSTYVDQGAGLPEAGGYLTRLREYAGKFSKFEAAAGAFERWREDGGLAPPPSQPTPQPEEEEEEEEPKAAPAARSASFGVERKTAEPARGEDAPASDASTVRDEAISLARTLRPMVADDPVMPADFKGRWSARLAGLEGGGLGLSESEARGVLAELRGLLSWFEATEPQRAAAEEIRAVALGGGAPRTLKLPVRGEPAPGHRTLRLPVRKKIPHY